MHLTNSLILISVINLINAMIIIVLIYVKIIRNTLIIYLSLIVI